jgi:predicted permease
VTAPLQLRYALRVLAKTPVFTLAAVLVLALGIGANTAIFTVVRAVLLAPLPYRDADRLVRLYERFVVSGDEAYNVVSPQNYRDWIDQSQSFEQIAAIGDASFTLTSADGTLPEVINGEFASANLFPTLGVTPALGRAYASSEDDLKAPLLAVIGDSLWRRRFAADPSVIGSQIKLNGVSYTLLGVMPPGFDYPASGTQIWVSLWRHLQANSQHSRGNHRLSLVARLRSGVSVAAAGTELEGIAQRIHQLALNTGEITGKGANVAPLAEMMVARVRPTLLALFGAVACVLLIACVNVTNLLLARAAARRREVAIRAALGAGRRQLLAQFLTESLLLSISGAGLGLLLASWGSSTLIRMAGDLPRIDGAGVNGVVLWFTLAIAILTGVSVGLVPAFSASRVALASAMHEGGRASTAGRSRTLFRDALVAAEVALSLMLLIACGLMLKSFARARAVDAGYSVHDAITLRVVLPSSRYRSDAQRLAFYETLLERVRALPGAVSAGLVTIPPLAGHWGDQTFTIVGRPPLPPGQFMDALNRSADPDYFRTLGIPLKRGRFFEPTDRLDHADKAIISEAFVSTFLPGEDPIGQHIQLGTSIFEIVGVVGDVRKVVELEPQPTMYFPQFSGSAGSNVITLVVRTQGDPNALAMPVQRELSRLDPQMPATAVRTMEEIADNAVKQRRFTLVLLSLFAGLAVLLASIGLYGVLAYNTQQRTGELGIRMALGASGTAIVRLVLAQGLKPALAGILIGLAGGAAATRLLESLLFGVKPSDPQVLAGVVIVIAAVSAAASLLPAWRATRIDPATALR